MKVPTFPGRSVHWVLFGCRIEIDVLFCGALSLLLLLDQDGVFLWCVIAAALHELGHIFAMRLLHYPPCTLCLTGFGAKLSYQGPSTQSYGKDFLVCIAGPLCNILVFFLLLIIGGTAALPWQEAKTVPAYTQLALGAFNLLPIEPLDGGQAIGAVLRRFFSQEKAEFLGGVLTFCFLFPLGVIGFLILFESKGNYSLLLLTFYLMILFVLKRR